MSSVLSPGTGSAKSDSEGKYWRQTLMDEGIILGLGVEWVLERTKVSSQSEAGPDACSVFLQHDDLVSPKISLGEIRKRARKHNLIEPKIQNVCRTAIDLKGKMKDLDCVIFMHSPIVISSGEEVVLVAHQHRTHFGQTVKLGLCNGEEQTVWGTKNHAYAFL